MRTKLKLHLEDLTVDSFDTSGMQKPKGTVFGEQCTCYTNCTCPGCPTCDASCNGTCGGTCGENTCGATCNGTCAPVTCRFSCGYTTCECPEQTCLDTACGNSPCCI